MSKLRLSTNYGSWDKNTRTHAVILEERQGVGDTGKRLCDDKRSIYNMGLAGYIRHITCKRCLKKLEGLDYEEVME